LDKASVQKFVACSLLPAHRSPTAEAQESLASEGVVEVLQE
jgi:hypothetical protein